MFCWKSEVDDLGKETRITISSLSEDDRKSEARPILSRTLSYTNPAANSDSYQQQRRRRVASDASLFTLSAGDLRSSSQDDGRAASDAYGTSRLCFNMWRYLGKISQSSHASMTLFFSLAEKMVGRTSENQWHNISEDTWRQVLAFSRRVHENLEGYDPEEAWSVLNYGFAHVLTYRKKYKNVLPNFKTQLILLMMQLALCLARKLGAELWNGLRSYTIKSWSLSSTKWNCSK